MLTVSWGLASQKNPRVDTSAFLQSCRDGLCRGNGVSSHHKALCQQEHLILAWDLLPKAAVAHG